MSVQFISMAVSYLMCLLMYIAKIMPNNTIYIKNEFIMNKKINEGLRKTQCCEFSDFLYDNFYYIQQGKKRTADVVREFLDSIGKTNDKNAFDQLLKYAKKEVLQMQQNSENERFGGDDGNLWKNKKVKISETKLKSIIRESIEEIMTGDYINQGIDKQWADPNSPLRQFGNEWLRATLDLCKKYDSAIHPQELISLMKPIAVKIIMKKR